ncbi:MAG: GNAT family N-acetyltransferase [Parvibaculum sp.]
MIEIRPLGPADKQQWLPLWQGYLDFYKTELAPEVTENSWARLLSPDEGLHGIAATDKDGCLVGIAHYLLHPGTWDVGHVCYLEDLFVAENTRELGIGRALIDYLATQGRAKGWERVYWQTASDNHTAQALYEKIATRKDWVRYEIDL